MMIATTKPVDSKMNNSSHQHIHLCRATDSNPGWRTNKVNKFELSHNTQQQLNNLVCDKDRMAPKVVSPNIASRGSEKKLFHILLKIIKKGNS